MGSWDSEVSTEPSSHPRGLLDMEEMMNYSRSEPDWARVAGAAARIRIRQNMTHQKAVMSIPQSTTTPQAEQNLHGRTFSCDSEFFG